jgi:hypothetical protein
VAVLVKKEINFQVKKCGKFNTGNISFSRRIYYYYFFSGTTAQRGPGPPHSLRFVDDTQ